VPRPPREDFEGAIHHVYARGNDRRDVFLDDADRWIYLGLLGRVTAGCAWRCLSYCLMRNHLHLLIETPRGNLAAGMQVLHGRYAQRTNRRHGRTGHVFQGRYGAVRVRTDPQLWATVAYIARNPADAGLCARPDEWPWSSHGAAARGRAPGWLDRGRLSAYLAAVTGRRRSPAPTSRAASAALGG